jgi:exportin-1
MEDITRRPTTRWVKLRHSAFHSYHPTGIRNFVVGATVKVASDETLSRKEKTYINKLNLALIQVRLHHGVCHWQSTYHL